MKRIKLGRFIGKLFGVPRHTQKIIGDIVPRTERSTIKWYFFAHLWERL